MESVVLPVTVPEEERDVVVVTVIDIVPVTDPDDDCVLHELCDTLLLPETESEGVCVTD
jgi:hypothetical protein